MAAKRWPPPDSIEEPPPSTFTPTYDIEAAPYNTTEYHQPTMPHPQPKMHSSFPTPGQPTDGDKLFDITCTIGSVYRDAHANFSARTMAFIMIADHTSGDGSPGGTYQFPNEDGSINYVTVEVTPPAPPTLPTPKEY